MDNHSTGAFAWLPYLPMAVPQGQSPGEIAASELQEGFRSLRIDRAFKICAQGPGESYELEEAGGAFMIKGGGAGVLYGAYRLLSLLARGEPLPKGTDRPVYPLRMLNHWDNMDGSVERGYAGRSFFFRNGRVGFDPQRVHRYARMLASVGINAVCPNNVNVRPPMDRLITGEALAEVSRLADILRLYGIRMILAVDFSLPAGMGCGTADPLVPEVIRFWAERADEVYRAIPDLAGFLVKADSEHRPGPFTYGRSHDEGANTLARALKPHGGRLFWRCFVYNCRQDWRDGKTDRPRAAYDYYAPLDGRFDDNVVLQIKNGPMDFQVREPVSPLLLGMPGTRKALELQLAQEYSGHQIDLFYQAAQWRDVLSVLPPEQVCCVSAVTNLGDDMNWTGHDLAQANLYAYGRLAWTGRSEPERYAREWADMTLPRAAGTAAELLLASPDAFEKYAAPLSLGFMVNPHTHYGPSPDGYEYAPWGTYHRADREAVGVDRGQDGTGFTAQYPESLRALYNDPGSCPDKLLLFFHRLPYGYIMRDGRTLLQRIYDDHFEGAEEVLVLLEKWKSLRGLVPDGLYERVLARFELQASNAAEWRDVINNFFFRFSGVPDKRGRKIWP